MSEILAIDLEATGRNIKKLRIDKNITIKQMQDIFGFSSVQAIYKWQQGKSLPSVDNLVILSKLFQVSIEEILVLKGSAA